MRSKMVQPKQGLEIQVFPLCFGVHPRSNLPLMLLIETLKEVATFGHCASDWVWGEEGGAQKVK